MKRFLSAVLGGVVLLGAVAGAEAGNSASGTVTQIIITNAGGTGNLGVGLFTLTGSKVSAPACNTIGNRWAIDLGASGGKAAYAAVLAAYLSGKTLSVNGTGDCGIWGDTESALYVITP